MDLPLVSKTSTVLLLPIKDTFQGIFSIFQILIEWLLMILLITGAREKLWEAVLTTGTKLLEPADIYVLTDLYCSC